MKQSFWMGPNGVESNMQEFRDKERREMKHKYTVVFTSGQEIPTESLLRTLTTQYRDVEEFQAVRESVRVYYPSVGAKYIKRIFVKFTKPVSKDAADAIVNYWASIPYVGKLSDIDWVKGSMIVWLDASQSRSHDIESRKILELLLNYLEDGTVLRTDNTRQYNGFGKNAVVSIIGYTG